MIIDDQDILRRSSRLGRWYAQRVFNVIAEDLAGAAALAQLTAAPGFDEARGNWGIYAHTVGVRAIRHELRLRHPVSGARSRQSAANDKLRATQGIAFVDTPSASDETSTKVLIARGHTIAVDAQLEEQTIQRAIRARVEELLGEQGAMFALAVLTGEVRPAELAALEGVSVTEVNAAQKRVRKKLRNDERLRQLWSDEEET